MTPGEPGAGPAPSLDARVEEALLGALISDPDQVPDMPRLDASAFTDPGRQAVWAAISRLREVAEGASGREFADLILATTDSPAITSEYLTRLALSAPTPGAADAYAVMVAEATLTRDFVGELYPAGPLTGGPDIRAGLSYSACLSAARSALGENLASPSPAPAGERAAREEQFVAGVIGQPALTDWISLDPDILTTPGLRTTYRAALTARELEQPADELTVTWRAASIVAHCDYTAGHVTTPDTVAATIPPGTIARLTAAQVDPPTALEAGRDLLAQHARDQIAAQARTARYLQRGTAARYDRTQGQQRQPLTGGGGSPLRRPPDHQQAHQRQLGQEGS